MEDEVDTLISCFRLWKNEETRYIVVSNAYSLYPLAQNLLIYLILTIFIHG